MIALSGCLAVKAVTAPVKLVAVTVITVSETAGAAVINTGKVARAAFSTAGMTAETVESLARLSQAGMVTFVDVANDSIIRVPWQEGLTLATSGQLAHVDYASKAIAWVRAGRLVLQAGKAGARLGQMAVQPGDVIRLAAGGR